jgi:hypothetical protein
VKLKLLFALGAAICFALGYMVAELDCKFDREEERLDDIARHLDQNKAQLNDMLERTLSLATNRRMREMDDLPIERD